MVKDQYIVKAVLKINQCYGLSIIKTFPKLGGKYKVKIKRIDN